MFIPGPLTAPGASALRQLQADADALRRRLDSLVIPSDDFFPASLTSGTGPFAWTERTFDASGARYNKPGGRTGTATWMPADLPNTGAAVTGLPYECWLKRKVVTAPTGPTYEVIGAPADGAAVLQVQPWSALGTPTLAIGYEARVQRWVASVAFATAGSFADTSPVQTVYVRDPNGCPFRPGEYVYAKFVESYSGLGGSGNVYERIGLDAPFVNAGYGSIYQPEYPGGGFPAVRDFVFRSPVYADHPYDASTAGQVRLHVAASTATTRGILMGVAEWSSDPYREDALCQWARGGVTGFTRLFSGGLVLSDGVIPSASMLGGAGGQGTAIPPDGAFVEWASGGSASLAGGHGQFDLGVTYGGGPSKGFQIDVRGDGKFVVGTASNSGAYGLCTINTNNFAVTSPGLSGGTGRPLFTTNLAVEFGGQIGAAFLWIAAPNHNNFTGIGDAYGSVTSQGAQGLLVTSPVQVTIGGTINLGFGTFSRTNMVGQNYVFPGGASGGGLPGANLFGSNFPPTSRAGAIFINGIYVGGLEWLDALRETPGTSSLHTPPDVASVDVHMYTPPGYTPPPGPTYPSMHTDGYWTTMSSEYF
jgi:hypothetical protein